MSETDKNSNESGRGSFFHHLFLAKMLFWGIAIAIIALDLGTKTWAENNLTYEDFNVHKEQSVAKLRHDHGRPGLEDGYEYMPGFIHLKWAENYGAAFSLGAGSGGPGIFVFLSVGVLGILFFYVYQTPTKRWFLLFCLGLIAGGAIGNLHDRVLHTTVDDRRDAQGVPIESYGEETTAVRDFLYWPFDIPLYSDWNREQGGSGKWPIFNVADAGIVGGVIGMALLFLFVPENKGRRRKEDEDGKTTEKEESQKSKK